MLRICRRSIIFIIFYVFILIFLLAELRDFVRHNMATMKNLKRASYSHSNKLTVAEDQYGVQHMRMEPRILDNSLDKVSNVRHDILPAIEKEMENTVATTVAENTVKSILIYSTLFGLEYWPTLDLKEKDTFMERCEIKECTITYNKEEIVSADAVLFHGVDVQNEKKFSADILRNVSKQRRLGQKWVFFIQESPDNYNGFSSYAGLFDWVMSYKHSSEIVIPYGHYKALETWDKVPEHINFALGKDKLGIWFVSNCGHPRDSYMQELKKYTSISVGGKCSMKLFNESVKCDHGSDDCIKFIKRHKFIFAFENSFCDYYVSEKYWSKGIDFGLVPVVMGATYNDNNVIPGSYIDASNYTTIEDLGNYLNYLDTHDDEYNKYFLWKQKYKRTGYEKMCELCKVMHENRESKPYKDVWSAVQDCRPFEWKMERMLRLAVESKKHREIT